ncbi:poly(3-hydroxybutyrate) depolymerase [Friedmanniella endophytica]|uniref:Poly(3-hydroxybutyrate) depolymerase n=1 Tax=Microlunatus kandeliicorticis TaxID=1759536 RepID=A0A7W3IU28_9ACTN|nr:PHB depolymerase family esterase [Microlunatus kandeliicorticis]MBA8795266.1 poly(3-hydroxybutyrate) depolymerase [Microlunatus kandeliicorticis]
MTGPASLNPDHSSAGGDPTHRPTPPLGRRSLLAAAAAAPLAAAVAGTVGAPTAAAAPSAADRHPRPGGRPRFTLDAEVLDGGEQVVGVTIDPGRIGPIDPASLTTDTFTVHAKAVSPVPVAAGDQIFSEYDLDRTVTAVRVDRSGRIVVALAYAEGAIGGGTLGYLLNEGRNVQLDLTYTITQNAPFRLRNGRKVTLSGFTQGRLVSPEVDAFGRAVSRSGLNYRLYDPNREHGRGHGHQGPGRGRRRPLIVWLHGAGEGGLGDYYTNEPQLRANRGALGFATPEGQRIFGGAYVVAPQSPTAWFLDGPGYAPRIRSLIAELVRRYPIDTDRIHVVGCSSGGFMTAYMEYSYPTLFASGVPICPAIAAPAMTDAQIRVLASTPSWFVHSLDDPTVNPQTTSIRAHALLPDTSLITLYDHVVRNGYTFNGHWSWIYVARNDPATASGQHIWQWMASHRR